MSQMYVPGNDVSLYFRFLVIAIMIFSIFATVSHFLCSFPFLVTSTTARKPGRPYFRRPAPPALAARFCKFAEALLGWRENFFPFRLQLIFAFKLKLASKLISSRERNARLPLARVRRKSILSIKYNSRRIFIK